MSTRLSTRLSTRRLSCTRLESRAGRPTWGQRELPGLSLRLGRWRPYGALLSSSVWQAQPKCSGDFCSACLGSPVTVSIPYIRCRQGGSRWARARDRGRRSLWRHRCRCIWTDLGSRQWRGMLIGQTRRCRRRPCRARRQRRLCMNSLRR